MKKYCMFFLWIGMCHVVSAHAMEWNNETKADIVVKIYSGGQLCYESYPIAKHSIFKRPKPPRKCSSGVYKLKAQQGRNACRMVDLGWEEQIVFAQDGGKLVCKKPSKAGH